MHDVVVTGMGVVGPLGVGRSQFMRRMFAGESGIVEIRGCRVGSHFPIQVAGIIPEEHESQWIKDSGGEIADVETLSRTERYACLATREALAGLPPESRVDALVYATLNGADFVRTQEFARAESPLTFDWRSTRSENGLLALRRLIQTRCSFPLAENTTINITNACISSAQAIGLAFQRIRHGHWSRAVVGGADARCDAATLMDFHLLHALSTHGGSSASRPFCKSRNGFVLGEGAATLVLETRQAAEERGAIIFGKVAGYASTSDAFRISDGRPDAIPATRALTGAMADAGRSPLEIDAVSAHGTSTPLNDRLESQAIRQALGSRAYKVPVTALKSQVGHTTLASGAMQAVASFLMLNELMLAPTINYEDPDPECDLDYVPNRARPAQIKTMLSNSFGFGGQNACLVLEGGEA